MQFCGWLVSTQSIPSEILDLPLRINLYVFSTYNVIYIEICFVI